MSKISLGVTLLVTLIWLGSGIWLVLQFAGPKSVLDHYLASGTEYEDANVVLTTTAHIIFAIAYLISFAISGLVLFALWRFFGELMKGTIFSEASVLWARRAGLGLLTNAIYGVMFTALQVFVLSLYDDLDHMTLTIGLQRDEAVALIASAVLVTIGHVLQLSTQIEQENKSFV